MVNDAILSREAALMYKNIRGFQPVNNNILEWEGYKLDKNKEQVLIRININSDFPNSPPQAIAQYLDTEIPITTMRLERWRPDYHIFQVALEAIQKISSMIRPIGVKKEEDVPLKESKILQNQVKELNLILDEKLEKQNRLQVRLNSDQSFSKEERKSVIQDTIYELEAEISTLEEQFEAGNISTVDFCKKFFSLRSRYLLIQQTN